MNKKNYYVAAILAMPLLLGPFGVHKFYLGEKKVGIWYLVGGITGLFLIIPIIITIVLSTIDMVKYLKIESSRKSLNKGKINGLGKKRSNLKTIMIK